MRIDIVTVDVKPEHKDRFIQETLLNARASIKDEPGCVRWDVLQDTENPNRIYLYEVYRDKAAEDAHVKMPHFLRWEEATKDWFAKPYQVAVCDSIFPEDSVWA